MVDAAANVHDFSESFARWWWTHSFGLLRCTRCCCWVRVDCAGESVEGVLFIVEVSCRSRIDRYSGRARGYREVYSSRVSDGY